MNAKEYCKKLDNELGETWSNDYIELPEKMEEYAKIYHEHQLKILNIPVVSVSLPKNTTIWKKAREMEFAYFRKWWFSRVGNDR